ncbi:MAG TPA: hypothetical protein VK137_05320, partial [Planctomycetaceae bacterium]|nr:hypothetical protein [Planctomycetaceae bacterium]
MNRLLRVGTVLLALSTVLLPRLWLLAAEDEAVPTDRLLPPDVSVYVSIPSVDDLKARWGHTAFGGIAEDPAFEPFKNEISKVLEHLSGEVEKNLGVTLKDLLEVPSGELAAAVLTPPGQKISAVLFLDFGDNEKTVEALLDKAEKALEEQGATSDDEEIDGTKTTVWTLKKEDEEDQKPNHLVYFTKDTMLVLSSDLDTAKAVLTRWDGKHSDTFADNDNYNLILEKCKTDDEDGLLVWYINPLGLVQAAIMQAAAANPQAQLAMVFLEPLGINGVKAVGGSFDMGTEKFDSVSKTFLFIEQPTKGLLNVFQFPAAEQKPPRWVSSNASAWFSLNWDIAGAFKAVGLLVDMMPNGGPGKFESLIEQLAQQEPKVHIKKDLIDLLSGRIQVVVEPGKKTSDAAAQDRVVVALGLKDAKKFQGTLAKITKVPGFPGKTREFKGSTIYEFEVPDFTGGGEPKQAGLAVGKDQLLLSNDVTSLEAMLRGDTDGDALVDSAAYKKIAEHLPAKASIVSFSRQDSQLETLWSTARSGQFHAAIPDVDFSKLPEFDAVRKYLSPGGGYAVPDMKGVLFVGFSGKP